MPPTQISQHPSAPVITAKENQENKAIQHPPSRHVRINGLPKSVDKAQLEGLLSPIGGLEAVEVENETAWADFVTIKYASAAIKHLNKSNFQGGKLNSSFTGGHPSRTIWVGNVTTQVSKDKIFRLFQKYGSLESVERRTKTNCAVVSFTSLKDAQEAFQGLQGYPIGGGLLKLGYKTPKEGSRPKRPHSMTLPESPTPKLQRISQDGATRFLRVEGVAWSDLNQISSRFSPFGKIERITWGEDAKTCFIEYVSRTNAIAAKTALHKSTHADGSTISIVYQEKWTEGRETLTLPKKREERGCLWIENVTSHVTATTLYRTFKRYGDILGYGFQRQCQEAVVVFAQESQAEAAISALNRTEINGGIIRIQRYWGSLAPYGLKDQLLFEQGQPLGLYIRIPRGTTSPSELDVYNEFLPYHPYSVSPYYTEARGQKYCFVNFTDVDNCRQAREKMQGRLFGNPNIKVNYATHQPHQQQQLYIPQLRQFSPLNEIDQASGTEEGMSGHEGEISLTSDIKGHSPERDTPQPLICAPDPVARFLDFILESPSPRKDSSPPPIEPSSTRIWSPEVKSSPFCSFSALDLPMYDPSQGTYFEDCQDKAWVADLIYGDASLPVTALHLGGPPILLTISDKIVMSAQVNLSAVTTLLHKPDTSLLKLTSASHSDQVRGVASHLNGLKVGACVTQTWDLLLVSGSHPLLHLDLPQSSEPWILGIFIPKTNLSSLLKGIIQAK